MTEDLLSEKLAHRILYYVDPSAFFGTTIGRKGIGYIKDKLDNLNKAAKGLRIVVIVDRDRPQNCPIELIQKWIKTEKRSSLVVRFAEMEIESWIMADRERVAHYLSVSLSRISSTPDQILDPKREIVNIARYSKNKRIRGDMCPPRKSTAVVGPAYNTVLEDFIINYWRPELAIKNSPSLSRSVERIRSLAHSQI